MFKELTKRLFSSTPLKDVITPTQNEHIHKIRLFHGNVLDHTDCAALVSFVTADLSLGGPLNKAFLDEAGDELGDYIADNIIKPKPGDVFVVPSFNTPVKNIVLAVLPEWRGGLDDEDRAMIRCYRRSIEKAKTFGLRTVAFPALGFGRLNFPHIRFARHAVRGILDALDDQIDEVRIVCKEEDMTNIYARHLEKIGWKPD